MLKIKKSNLNSKKNQRLTKRFRKKIKQRLCIRKSQKKLFYKLKENCLKIRRLIQSGL